MIPTIRSACPEVPIFTTEPPTNLNPPENDMTHSTIKEWADSNPEAAAALLAETAMVLPVHIEGLEPAKWQKLFYENEKLHITVDQPLAKARLDKRP